MDTGGSMLPQGVLERHVAGAGLPTGTGGSANAKLVGGKTRHRTKTLINVKAKKEKRWERRVGSGAQSLFVFHIRL